MNLDLIMGVFFVESRNAAASAAVVFSGKAHLLASAYARTYSTNASRQWISGAFAVPAAGLDYQ